MTWRYLGSLLLLFVPSSLGEFFVETVREPVVAEMGGDVILDCQLTPAVMPVEMEVRWFRQDWSQVVHLYRDGRDHPEAQEGRYSGRTQLFPDQLAVGNVSLLLRGVNIGDQGGYKCFVVSRNQDKEDSLQLNVKSLGDQPLLRAVSYEGNAVKLGCLSQGWFPRPGVEWRDGEGGQVEGHEVEVKKGPTGLMTLESTVTVTADQRGPFTCSINNTLGDSRHAQLDISGDFFPHTSGWLVGFWVIFLVLLGGLVAACVLIRMARKRDRMMKELRMRPTIRDYETLRHNLAKQEDEAKQEKQKYLEDLGKERRGRKALA
ncbi:butyrophilin-like protein 1, partial [Rhinoraja longicauda]